MNIKNTKNIPTIFIILGSTGDLMARKIAPALFNLFEKNKLPSMFKVVGVARHNFSDKDFRENIKENLLRHKEIMIADQKADSFLSLFLYSLSDLRKKADYKKLGDKLKSIDDSWGVCSNKLFYLAVTPNLYKNIFENLASSGMSKPCSQEQGWTRIIVEKPFGKDLKTAEKLDTMLGQLFKEVQIYRIDHYLAKEMIQNILSFRFANNLFEQTWSRKYIEKIEIQLWESLGVETRGSFYDSLGALRDVGQNHLLQMLALVAMDHPLDFNADTIRTKRAEVLKTLNKLSRSDLKKYTFRAQYEGYRNIKDVASDSQTETFFRIKATLDMPRLRGVPIILESGKKLAEARKQVVITIRHPIPCLCPTDAKEHYKNKIIIALEPKENITIQFWSKKPGLEFKMEERELNFSLREAGEKTQYVEEYEKLLLDCISGDQTLFVSTDEVKAMWRFVDPIFRGWKQDIVPLETYKPNSLKIIDNLKLDGDDLRHKGYKGSLGVVGLGKMGANIARQLMSKGWRIVGYDKSQDAVKKMEKEGMGGAYSLKELADKLDSQKVIWIMVPAGNSVDEAIFAKGGLGELLKKGDIIIDAGNSFFEDTEERYKKLKKTGINFVDVGVSGGPAGALTGASLMIGGSKKNFEKLERLFADVSQDNGYQFFEGEGAGHFVKMVHNGIEYGMMQSLAEGFAIMKNGPYKKLDLAKIVEVYNHGSVIESRLVGWLGDVYEKYGQDLKEISGRVAHTGEGAWTVNTASKLKIPAPIIKAAFDFRVKSKKNPSYTGKILSALRNQFGGHNIK